ncbi:immunoglobulin-like domain-containing protein [Catenibacterium sp. AM22-15]|uniref:immunoglobulin-like domain-containing protein n=1 Tax=Catenibacterium sp. AM22-15 TaxID=2292991 RepID=UPI001F38E591|nr:immunoglobulin-like domain-containing protein [Catenibacterium sp. AM22-15]
MNIKKFTSYAVALMMSLSLAPVKANALTTDGSLTKGYYNDVGQWVEGQLSQTLPEGIQSVDKTAEAFGNNTYKMRLKVVTKQKVETFTKKAATVLVIDSSGSMIGKKRMKSIRDAAKTFVQSYAGKDKNTGRYLAIVDFDSDVEVRLNWTDVSSTEGKETAYEAIDDLRALGSTNLDAGIKQGTALFKNTAIKDIKKENRNAIVFTDGKPKKYLVECQHKKPKKNDIVIDGVVYDKKNKGGVEAAAKAAAKDAKFLRDQSTVYAVSYGNDKKPMWKGGPTVSEYLRGSIATSPDKGYDRSETDDLTELFKAISDSITTGITGKDLEVFDGSAPYVSVNSLPTSVQQDASGFKWKLANPTTKTEGKATYYTYELEYTVTLDADHPGFEEGKLYPLNGETYITMPNGSKVKFPVPGATGIKTRYTVTYTDGVDGEVVFEDKVFNVVVGSSTPGFGGTPTRAGYTFTGWSPAVEEKVTKSITYNATWVMNMVPINEAPVIHATDKTITVGDEFDPRADVTATDEEDGNLTSKIIVEKNDVKTDVAGQYEVTYKVTDNQGATRRKTIIVTINPKMEVLNEAPVIHATDKTITVGDTFDPMAGVTAEDAEDGNLTTKIVVEKNDVKTDVAGKYEVTYKVTDNQGATRRKTIIVTINPKMEELNEAPVIHATDKTITVGDTFDPMAGVTATDTEDGNLTTKIEVKKNDVDTTTPGKYEVTYKVTDNQGASFTKSITVTVNPKMEVLNEAPVIHATDKTITVGDTFDPMAGVTATDAEDGNLTTKIEVKKNDVDTTKAGKYEVTYKVTDNQGATCTKTIAVIVNPKMEVLNEAPTIDAADKTITVGDTFDPKAGVTAKDAEDGDLTDKIEVVKNTVDTKKAGKYEVTYKVTDSDGATRTKTIKVTVKEKAPAPSTDKDKTPTTPNKDKDKTTIVAPKTGDTTSVNTIIALLAVSGIALLALLKRKKVS